MRIHGLVKCPQIVTTVDKLLNMVVPIVQVRFSFANMINVILKKDT